MNRLTKNIALVLISSSLALFGCGAQEEPREFSDNGDFGDLPADSGAPRGSGFQPGGGSYSPSHGYYYYHNGTRMFYGGGIRPGTTFYGHTGSTFSGSPHTGSSSAGSTHGGFGASAHGGGS